MDVKIFDIQRFCIHDGPGIRTTVFFKGCPLRCKWCHNPESQRSQSELMFYADKCTGCGRCREVCEKAFTDACKTCSELKCVDVCRSSAREKSGRTASTDEIVNTALRDIEYYRTSGGGVTLSGGEPLMQADAALEILKRCKQAGLHTAVETAGFIPRENLEKVMDYVDLFLFDIKGIDSVRHKENTGADNTIILENADFLRKNGREIRFRMPVIPGFNDGEIKAAAEFAGNIPLEILGYHIIGNGKYKSLSRQDEIIDSTPPEQDEMKALADKYSVIYNPTGL